MSIEHIASMLKIFHVEAKEPEYSCMANEKKQSQIRKSSVTKTPEAKKECSNIPGTEPHSMSNKYTLTREECL